VIPSSSLAVVLASTANVISQDTPSPVSPRLRDNIIAPHLPLVALFLLRRIELSYIPSPPSLKRHTRSRTAGVDRKMAFSTSPSPKNPHSLAAPSNCVSVSKAVSLPGDVLTALPPESLPPHPPAQSEEHPKPPIWTPHTEDVREKSIPLSFLDR